MSNTSCEVKKTRKIKNSNGTKSTFKLVKGGQGLTEAEKDKKKAAIQRKGKRVSVIENSCGYNVYEGPKRKAVTLKSGQRLSGTKKRKKTTRKKRK